MPIEVTSADFAEKILNSDQPALVDFWAPWCGPCQMMHPVLEQVATKYEGRAVVAKCNIDEANNQELAQKYQVRAIPYIALFKGGEIVEEIVGVRPQEDLEAALDRALA